jgi:aurora kinase
VKLDNVNFEFGRLSSPSALLNRRRVEEIPTAKIFTLNDFELVDKIGKGAFGDVFISREKVTGFLCVLKKISKKKIREQKLEQTMLREIKIQSFLKHKHLTPLFGFFDDQEYLYLIL